MKKRILKLSNITKKYHTEAEEILVLEDLNLDVYETDMISIKGKSGSGKSSLLNIIGRLDTKFEGDLDYKGDIGFVFQFHHLLEEFSVIENVMLAYLVKDKDKQKAKEKAKEMLNIVGLSHRLDFYPSQISGGEKQRVAIARALINAPDIILADEPTGNLDEENSKIIEELFVKLNKKYGKCIIIVTHSETLANICNKKYILEKRKLREV